MANPTTNYGWPMPTSTDLVTDLPADFAAFGQPVDTTLKALNPETTLGDISYRSATSNTNTRLGIGTNGQVLAVSGGVPAWTTTSDVTPLTTKGDLFTFDTADARLAVGTNGQTLVADSTAATGLKWATPSSTPTFVGCSIYNSGGLSPANATDTMLTFDSEFFDSNGFHDTSTNTGRVTIPTGYGGKYLINYAVRAVANSTGYRTLTIYKNGTSLVQFMDQVANGSVTSYPARSIILNLAAGDYLTFYYYQNSGGALTVYVREYEMPVQVQWLGA